MRELGLSERDVETQLGHKRPDQTEIYITFNLVYLKGAAAALEKLARATPRKTGLSDEAERRVYSEG